MGFFRVLFGRRVEPVPVTGWETDGLGVDSRVADEDSGAEDGTAYSTGFVNDDLPGRYLLVTYYPVRPHPPYAEWGVERRVTWIIRDDPNEEPWFEESSMDLMPDRLPSEADALTAANIYATMDAGEDQSGAAIYGTWDGEPFDPSHTREG